MPTRFLLLTLLLLAPFRSPAKDTWLEVTSPHFLILSNAGESQARKIADQFEQFREVFHTSFPKLRIDLGKPLVIFVLKNEDSLKLLLPGYWEVKGRVHPAGIFVPGEERHFVALRTDTEGDNPYEVVYHEYTHAIMGLNFQGLPVWLSEGLAEYFGNSAIHEKDIAIGKISPYHLQVLRDSRLIPIDSLLTADSHSPYYNEQNRASLFYAESWAIVHYLLNDPPARKQQLLANFLSSWDSSGDQLQAARQTFGDLKKFAYSMEHYARQPNFYFVNFHSSIHGDPKSYAVRPLPPAELAAHRALFYLHTQRMEEAKSSVDEAVQSDPNSPLAHEARGLLFYHQQDFPAAQSEFDRALALNASSYVVYFFAAQSRLRRGQTAFEEIPEITANLEKSTQLNPEFAPAYATLSSFYSMRDDSQKKALDLAKKAIELEPGNLFYARSYGAVLLNLGQFTAAKTLAARIQAAARTPQEETMAAEFANFVSSRQDAPSPFATASATVTEVPPTSKSKERTIDVEANNHDVRSASPTDSSTASPPADPPPHPRRTILGQQFQLEGKVLSADCPATGGVKLTMSIQTVSMIFHAQGLSSIEVTPASKLGAQTTPTCSGWKGLKAKIVFQSSKEGNFDGELNAIHFF